MRSCNRFKPKEFLWCAYMSLVHLNKYLLEFYFFKNISFIF